MEVRFDFSKSVNTLGSKERIYLYCWTVHLDTDHNLLRCTNDHVLHVRKKYRLILQSNTWNDEDTCRWQNGTKCKPFSVFSFLPLCKNKMYIIINKTSEYLLSQYFGRYAGIQEMLLHHRHLESRLHLKELYVETSKPVTASLFQHILPSF